MPAMYLIGDSTVDDFRDPLRGWGFSMPELVAEDVTVHNHAKAGRSARSFLLEKRFEPVEQQLQPGDILLMQFGHNDVKTDPNIHTDPETSYPEHLRLYGEAALKKGALPVLITPVSLRKYDEYGQLIHWHGRYPAAVHRLAEETGWSMVDLEQLSFDHFLQLGREETATLFVRLAPGEHPDYPEGRDDECHFNLKGSRAMALLVASALKKDPRCRRYFRP